jgi:prepilin-type N-terminal cleavage/methylation domain-containing protein/prepilin-type processing-associated H-X9-DG protein
MKLRCMKVGRSGRGGFTLIELLVVIAVIAILATLLLGGLSQAKSQAYQVECMSNLKQVMLAQHLYWPDYKEYVPWPNWAAGADTYAAGWAYAGVALTGEGQIGEFAMPNGPQNGLLWPYLKTATVYMCPLDMMRTNSGAIPPGQDGRPLTYAQLFQQRNCKFISWVCNGAVIDWVDWDILASNATYKNTVFLPGNVLYWEADERFPFDLNDGSSPPSQGLTTRHDNGGNIAAFDGHVEYIKCEKYYAEVDRPGPNNYWFWPGAPDGGYSQGY